MTALFAVVTEAVVAASRLLFLLSFPVHVFVLLSLWGGIPCVAVVTGARFFAVIPVRVVYVLLSSPGRAPERKPVSNDFNAALILPGGINIEISKPDVEGNGGSGLSADAGSSALEGPAPGAKDA